MKLTLIFQNSKSIKKHPPINFEKLTDLSKQIAAFVQEKYGPAWISHYRLLDYSVMDDQGNETTGQAISVKPDLGIKKEGDITIRVFIPAAILEVDSIVKDAKDEKSVSSNPDFLKSDVEELILRYDNKKGMVEKYFSGVEPEPMDALKQFIKSVPRGRLSAENIVVLLKILSNNSVSSVSAVVDAIRHKLTSKRDKIIATLQASSVLKPQDWLSPLLSAVFPLEMNEWCRKMRIKQISELEADLINSLYVLYIPEVTNVSRMMLKHLYFMPAKDRVSIQEQLSFYLKNPAYALQCSFALSYLNKMGLAGRFYPVITQQKGQYAWANLLLIVATNKAIFLTETPDVLKNSPIFDISFTEDELLFLKKHMYFAQFLATLILIHSRFNEEINTNSLEFLLKKYMSLDESLQLTCQEIISSRSFSMEDVIQAMSKTKNFRNIMKQCGIIYTFHILFQKEIKDLENLFDQIIRSPDKHTLQTCIAKMKSLNSSDVSDVPDVKRLSNNVSVAGMKIPPPSFRPISKPGGLSDLERSISSNSESSQSSSDDSIHGMVSDESGRNSPIQEELSLDSFTMK